MRPFPLLWVLVAGLLGPAHIAAGSSLPAHAVATIGDDAGRAAAPAAIQAERLRRLSALAALWGEIRYFHPALATRDIDWDRALVETIPRVNTARDAAQYRAAIDHLLGFLGDPATRTVRAGDAPPPLPLPAGKPPMIDERDGVATVRLSWLALAMDQAGSASNLDAALAPVRAAMARAQVVVLDCRTHRPADQDHYTGYLMAELIRSQSNRPLLQGALRYRTHTGYVPQTGSLSSGGYSSSLTSERPVEIPGHGAAPLPPLVFVVNENSAVSGELLSGLQATGRALVVSAGPVELGAAAYRVELGEGLHALVRSSELVAPDGSIGFRADYATASARSAHLVDREVEAAVERLRGASVAASVIASAGALPRPAAAVALATQRGGNDRGYPEMSFPAVEYRLLGLFRYWNVMDKFFPYKNLIGPSWDSLLARYIPALEANRDAADYQMTLRELATEIRDSHGGLRGDTTLSAERLGRNLPPAMPEFVQGETVIVHLLEEGTGLRVGDVVLSVDGRPITELREKMARYVPASTAQALQRDLHRNLFRGQPDSPVVLGVRGLDGSQRQARLTRSVPGSDPRLRAFDQRLRSTPVFGVLPGNIGYADLARLIPSDVDAMFMAIKDTPSAIFDMRGYPNGTAWSVAPRLTRRQQPVGAQFFAPLLHGRSRGDGEEGAISEFMAQRLPAPRGEPWLGKVVMLVNENTQSQAEHTGLFFEAATEVTFIGSPTAGANGDVTELALPGGFGMSFSGHDVRHADGRQLQRLGIQPDVPVAPTIAGLVRGEDEVLAAALHFLAAPAPPAAR